jgi:GNAT superfamily N-acetyltransferase
MAKTTTPDNPPDPIHISCLRGAQAAQVISALADLRISVFEEYPYLYCGRREDEIRYLEHYSTAVEALVLSVTDSGNFVGAATGIPLAQEIKELTDPFAGTAYRIEEIYYVGELLFYPAYRNRGLGVTLLAKVEGMVRALGKYRYLACATVVRPEGHPARPAGYLPIERFLARTGFRLLPGILTSFTWCETDGVSREHPMKFWVKELD